MESLTKRVANYMKKVPTMYDRVLIAHIWNDETPLIVTKEQFLIHLAAGELSNPASIAREKRRFLKNKSKKA